jgi:hypothetical protein
MRQVVVIPVLLQPLLLRVRKDWVIKEEDLEIVYTNSRFDHAKIINASSETRQHYLCSHRRCIHFVDLDNMP